MVAFLPLPEKPFCIENSVALWYNLLEKALCYERKLIDKSMAFAPRIIN